MRRRQISRNLEGIAEEDSYFASTVGEAKQKISQYELLQNEIEESYQKN